MVMSWRHELWDRTKIVATTYTWTFVAVILINQLVFFGFCLNPICLIAAMPHCLAITVFIGSYINKVNQWGRSDEITDYSSTLSASQLSKLLDDIDYNLKPDVASVAKKPASEVKEVAQQVLTPAIIVEPKSKSFIPMPDATRRNSSTTKLSESWEEYIEFIANNKNEK